MGVCGIELSWFIDYLSQRVQGVKFRDKVSSWSPVKGGVPQGSALAPLLFLIYVNAMPSLVECGRLLQFADNTTLICRDNFASATLCHLASTKSNFRFAATT